MESNNERSRKEQLAAGSGMAKAVQWKQRNEMELIEIEWPTTERSSSNSINFIYLFILQRKFN